MRGASRRLRPNYKVEWSPEFGRWVPVVVAIGAVGYFLWHLKYGEGTIGLSVGPGGTTFGTPTDVRADARIAKMVVGSAINVVPPANVAGVLHSKAVTAPLVLREDPQVGPNGWRALRVGKTWLYTAYKLADGSTSSFALEVEVVG